MPDTSERTPLLQRGLPTARHGHALNDHAHPLLHHKSEPRISSPRWHKLVILTGTFVVIFLSSVDTTITAALIQPIAIDLHDGSNNRASWLGPSYLLSSLILTPFYGRLCDIVGRRKAATSAVLAFLLGTLGCAMPQSMPHLISARMLAGCGYGGMMTTSAVLMADMFVFKERILYGGISGVFWTVSVEFCSAALGGPFGGLMHEVFGWRAAFMVQVPVLVVVLVGTLGLISYPVDTPPAQSSWKMLNRIDFGGCAALLLAFGTFLISLGLRNNELLSGSDPKVIITSVLAPVFLGDFFYFESNLAQEPILPLELLKPRTPCFALGVTFLVAITNSALLHHLPIYFLTVESNSGFKSGVHLLPVSAAAAIGGLASGVWMYRTGRYWTVGLTVSVVGALATYSTLLLRPSQPELFKWLLVVPFGIAPSVAKATSYAAMMAFIPPSQIPMISGALWAFRSAGQIIGLGLSTTVFQSLLVMTLKEELQEPVADELIHKLQEDFSVVNELHPELKAIAQKAFANATKGAFGIAVVGVTLAVISFALIPIHSLNVEEKNVPAAVTEVA
ncbi:BQ2448_5681 [Microbotryum intermedium]|uniref:BQ2448_5681 protein n=1 Tax=Microbotryum intermedium TaxID=269621 RepID=A0A238F1Z3_9BASI|nr:BQ2448_5681 [Microbotryum intermedium]